MLRSTFPALERHRHASRRNCGIASFASMRFAVCLPTPIIYPLGLRHVMSCEFRYQAFRFLRVAAENAGKPGDEASCHRERPCGSSP